MQVAHVTTIYSVYNTCTFKVNKKQVLILIYKRIKQQYVYAYTNYRKLLNQMHIPYTAIFKICGGERLFLFSYSTYGICISYPPASAHIRTLSIASRNKTYIIVRVSFYFAVPLSA